MLKNQKAFTLIELLVAMVVAGITLGIAVPLFNVQMLNSRSIAVGEELATAINFARSEAVKRSGRVTICASSDGNSCTGTWIQGWIVFVDGAVTDVASTPVITTPATDILRTWPAANANATISDVNSKTFIRFTSMGALGRIDNNPITITTNITGCKKMSARQITVGLSGVVNIRRIACI